MIQEKLFGNIGLNMDDDPRYFGADDSNLIVNMLPGAEDGEGGLLVTYPGAREIPTAIAWQLTDWPKVIGSCKRPDNDIIYFFVKGLSVHGDATTTSTTEGFDLIAELDFEYNSIIEFNPVTEVYRVIVFEEPYLYMDDWVYGAKVFGDYIIYNSGPYGMRKVHIEYAYRYYNGVPGDTYPEIISTTFALRNMPPTSRPTCAYITDATRYQNNLINKTFQFAYRYKYRESGYSVYSEFSDVCLAPNIEKWNGEYAQEQYENNALIVTFARGDDTVIEYVEIIVREGNDGDWRFFDSISGDVSTISFYNDENYETVDQDEVNKVEDAIPKQVADATLINENRLVVAGITEGFDNIDVNVIMTPVIEPVEIITPETFIGNIITSLPLDEIDPENEGVGFVGSSLDFNDYDEGDIIDLSFNFGGVTGEGKSYYHSTYVLTAANVASQDAFAAALHAALYSLLGGAVLYVRTIGKECDPALYGTAPAAWNTSHAATYDIEMELPFIGTWPMDGQITIYESSLVGLSGTNKWNTYKSGAIHPHAIQYWDEEFRRSTIMKSPACDVVVKERSYYATPQAATTTTEEWDVGMDYRIEINWIISHMAPSWARYWSWVYAGNKTQSAFVQYIITGTPQVVDGYLELDISPLQDLKTDTVTHPMYNSIIDQYARVDGDRIRILTGAPEGIYLGDSYQGDDYYDLPIAGLDENILRIASPDNNLFGTAEGSLVEIYTPRTFDEQYESYYLVDKINDVIDGYHMNPDGVSQSAGVSASGVLNSGDAYVIARAFSVDVGTADEGALFAVESMHWSDFYQSDAYDRGKPNLYSSLGEVTLNNIRWGWPHFAGVSINNLFTFDPGDVKSTTDIYGAITRIGEVGDVLKVIFERKVASMYIGRRQITDSTGSVFTVADTILSPPNYSIEDYGTTVPQAVIFVRGYCYFIDLYAGAIIRNTNNGSYPISGKVDAGGEGADYKMQTYFRDLCASVLDLGQDNVTMLIGWDDGRKLLYVSILHSSLLPYTAVFRESRGRWVSFLEFYRSVAGIFPTCYEWAGNKFFSWINGSESVWSHGDEWCTPLEVYDVAMTAVVAVWGNAQPNMMKVYDSIAVHTDNPDWAGSVLIPANMSYPNGMQSVLPNARFERREGAMYAEYLFNMMTNSATPSVLDLYRGESMRGYVIDNVLYIDTAAKLFKVDLNYRISNV